MQWLLGCYPSVTTPDPLPPPAPSLLTYRHFFLSCFPVAKSHLWRTSLLYRPSLLSRLFSDPSLDRRPFDTPSASVHRMYVFLVLGEAVRFGDEAMYFWSRPDWVLERVPRPSVSGAESSKEEEEARGEKDVLAVLAGTIRVLRRVLVDLDQLCLVSDDLRPARELPGWVEERPTTSDEVLLPDLAGCLPAAGEEDEDMGKHGAKMGRLSLQWDVD